jgi:hypothetical protein
MAATPGVGLDASSAGRTARIASRGSTLPRVIVATCRDTAALARPPCAARLTTPTRLTAAVRSRQQAAAPTRLARRARTRRTPCPASHTFRAGITSVAVAFRTSAARSPEGTTSHDQPKPRTHLSHRCTAERRLPRSNVVHAEGRRRAKAELHRNSVAVIVTVRHPETAVPANRRSTQAVSGV